MCRTSNTLGRMSEHGHDYIVSTPACVATVNLRTFDKSFLECLMKNKVGAKLHQSSKTGLNGRETPWQVWRTLQTLYTSRSLSGVSLEQTHALTKLAAHLGKYPSVTRTFICDRAGSTNQREKMDCLGVCGGKTGPFQKQSKSEFLPIHTGGIPVDSRHKYETQHPDVNRSGWRRILLLIKEWRRTP